MGRGHHPTDVQTHDTYANHMVQLWFLVVLTVAGLASGRGSSDVMHTSAGCPLVEQRLSMDQNQHTAAARRDEVGTDGPAYAGVVEQGTDARISCPRCARKYLIR